MLWVATFIAVCALAAAWAVMRDQAEARKRKLERIRRRLAEKEQAASGD